MHNNRLRELQHKLSTGPDILGRKNYISTAILVPLVIINGTEHLLFEKRASHIKQGGEICFPGGHYESDKDSSYIDTALREAQEELGLMPGWIKVIGQLDTLVSPRGLIVECFLGVLDIENIQNLTIDRKEVGDVFTIPISWFQRNPPEIYRTRVEMQSSYIDENGQENILLPVDELGLPPKYKENRSEYMHRVVVYRTEPDIIWGLTAAVVENMINKVFPPDEN